MTAGDSIARRESFELSARDEAPAASDAEEAEDVAIPSGSARWIPALDWLRRYNSRLLLADAIAGLTLAAYVLPAAIGDASLAQLPAEAGLYACMFAGLVYWCLCGSRLTAISVTSAISLLMGTSLGALAGGDAARCGALAACTALMVAAIAFAAWLVRAGSLVNFVSETVMIGFKAGVALTLASTQLPKLLGFPGAHGGFWHCAAHILRHAGETNPVALSVGLAALCVLVLGKVFLKNKPIALFVVIGGIVAAAMLGLEARGVKMLGDVPRGLPRIGLPLVAWEDLNELLPLALACFLLGAVETSGVGRMFAAKYGTRFNANQEFLALAGREPGGGTGEGASDQRRDVAVARERGGGRRRRCRASSPLWRYCWSPCFYPGCCEICRSPYSPRSFSWRWRACSMSPRSGGCGAPTRPSS